MAVTLRRAPGGDPLRGAVINAASPSAGLSIGGRSEGLGFVSKDYDDLFRPLESNLADKDPYELKPPYRVQPAKPEDLQVARYPMGILCVKLRMPSDKHSVDAVVKGEFMRWALVESLAETVTHAGKMPVRSHQILPCTNEVEILDVQLPFLGEKVWQFCEFRFDFRVAVKSEVDAQKAVRNVFSKMVSAEETFCKSLENKFRNIYHLTVMSVVNKRFLLMDGQQLSEELALFRAAQSNDTETVRALIQKGTDVEATQTPMSFPGSLLGDEERFLYLTLGRPPLLGAAEEGTLEAVQLLLDAHADVNFQDTSGFHALYLAAGAKEPAKLINALLAAGADLHLANSAGYTALHNACGSGEVEAVEALLQARADLNLKSRSGAAPVHVAVINNEPAVLEQLKQLRANLDMPAFGGNTPVHEGVMQNNPAIIQKLFDLGADVNIESGPDHDFATPLKMAQERRKKKALKKLQELGAVECIEHEYEELGEGELQVVPGGSEQRAPQVLGRPRW